MIGKEEFETSAYTKVFGHTSSGFSVVQATAMQRVDKEEQVDDLSRERKDTTTATLQVNKFS